MWWIVSITSSIQCRCNGIWTFFGFKYGMTTNTRVCHNTLHHWVKSRCSTDSWHNGILENIGYFYGQSVETVLRIAHTTTHVFLSSRCSCRLTNRTWRLLSICRTSIRSSCDNLSTAASRCWFADSSDCWRAVNASSISYPSWHSHNTSQHPSSNISPPRLVIQPF